MISAPITATDPTTTSIHGTPLHSNLAPTDAGGGIAQCTQMLANLFAARGTLRLRADDLEGALRDFNQALELDPENASVYFNRGAVHRRRGKKDDAAADVRKAILLDPQAATPAATRLESGYKVVPFFACCNKSEGLPLAVYSHSPDGLAGAIAYAMELDADPSLRSNLYDRDVVIFNGFDVVVYEYHTQVKEVYRQPDSPDAAPEESKRRDGLGAVPQERKLSEGLRDG